MKKMPVEEVWKYLPDSVQSIAMDMNGKVFGYSERAKMASSGWVTDGGIVIGVGIGIDFGTDDWTQTLRERPKQIKVGQFGKFWDDEVSIHRYDYLIEIGNGNFRFRCGSGSYWEYFKSIDPATLPKEIEI